MSAQPGCGVFVFIISIYLYGVVIFLLQKFDRLLVDIYSPINLHIINALRPESFHPDQQDRTA